MSDSMFNNDDIYNLLNEEIGIDTDKIKSNTDKIDVQILEILHYLLIQF